MIGRTTNGTRQQMGDAVLENLVGFETDDVFVILGFQKFIQVRQCKGSISSEVASQGSFPITLNDGFQYITPSVGTVDIARAQRAAFQITKLVKQK
jgi:hypothetical protein